MTLTRVFIVTVKGLVISLCPAWKGGYWWVYDRTRVVIPLFGGTEQSVRELLPSL